MPELTISSCPLQSRLLHIYYGQSYARVDFIPQLVTLHLASELCARLPAEDVVAAGDNDKFVRCHNQSLLRC